MKEKKVVLILDANKEMLFPILKDRMERCECRIEVLFETDPKVAEKIFEERKDEIAMVIVGSGVIHNISETKTTPITIDFVKKIKSNFSGVIMAVSCDPSYLKALMKAGCTVQGTDKSKFLGYILSHVTLED